jgi:hypothetical protein
MKEVLLPTFYERSITAFFVLYIYTYFNDIILLHRSGKVFLSGPAKLLTWLQEDSWDLEENVVSG